MITILFLWWYDQQLFQRVGSPSDVLSVNSDTITSIENTQNFTVSPTDYQPSIEFISTKYRISPKTSPLIKFQDNKPSSEFSLIFHDSFTLSVWSNWWAGLFLHLYEFQNSGNTSLTDNLHSRRSLCWFVSVQPQLKVWVSILQI